MCNTKEAKREKILEAAYHLFVKNGYKSTKIIDIAEAAGIGKGTVYEYFDSKATLLLDIISYGMEAYLGECESVMRSETNQTDKLVALIMLEAKNMKQNGNRILQMSQMILENSDGMPVEFINKMQNLWNKQYYCVSKILNDGIEKGEFRRLNTDLTAVAIMGASNGYLNIKYGVCPVSNMELPFKSESFKQQDFLDLMLRGIQADN